MSEPEREVPREQMEDEEVPGEELAGEEAHNNTEMETGEPDELAEPDKPEVLEEYDPLLDDKLLQPLLERREHSLKELLSALDKTSSIIPDAVTDYYLARAGFKTNDHRIKRLLALATQKFVSDIATDAFQYSRIRSQAGGAAAQTRRGAATGKTVLTLEDLTNVLSEYGINAKRPEFYR